MITSKNEYNELLYAINDPNNIVQIPGGVYFRIPKDEPVYNIDLNTREVETPKFLSVLEDHNAEIIWFKVDRFYDDVDLYNATCWIIYKNALGEDHLTITTPKVLEPSNHDILYIPWAIAGAATKAAGKITFSFQFFKVKEGTKDTPLQDKNNVYYLLHTKPATSQILHGMHIDPFKEETGEDFEQDPQFSELKRTLMELSSAYDRLSKDYELYWITVE